MSTDMSRPESGPAPHLRMTPITAERYVSAEYFQREGFRNLYNLRGGIDAWSLLVDPSVPRY